MSQQSAFLPEITDLLEEFAKSRNVDPANIQVRLTLVDGNSVTFLGFRTTVSGVSSGWGMVQGVDGDSADALLIRADHVFSAAFQIEPEVKEPIGFNR